MLKKDVLEFLKEGDATSEDVALEFGVSVKLAAAHLYQLSVLGRIRDTKRRMPASRVRPGQLSKVWTVAK